uniref:Secreted protein n=1 Tax=Rhinopithecus roxellana TaxID=61622 RepID=A0A2K6RFS8_RHIRO
MFPQRPFLYPFFLFLPWSSSPTSGCMFPPPCSAGFSLLTFSTAPASPFLNRSSLSCSLRTSPRLPTPHLSLPPN